MFIIKTRAKGQKKNTEYRRQKTEDRRQNFRSPSSVLCFPAFVFCLLLLADSLCESAQQVGKNAAPDTAPPSKSSAKDLWDPAKYISIDEITPGMKAYCLTCYSGTKIEKFDLDVISVVHNIEPGRDAILVQGTDKRFIYTGPVAGCSGSPVYIEGRLAGAMSFAWTLSKDPLYGVTPIKEMLKVGSANDLKSNKMGFALDFSKPIDFAEINSMLNSRRSILVEHSASSIQHPASSSAGHLSALGWLPCPLIISGLPPDACKQFEALLEPYGLMAVSGIGGNSDANNTQKVQLTPGAVLTVPLVDGDITSTVLGTVTEIVGDKVYGFGHSLLGYGAIDLPMATGQVHTIVSNLARSFKLGSSMEIVGALTTDEPTAIFGQIGATPQMIPLTIKVSRFNTQEQPGRLSGREQSRFRRDASFNCRLANNRLLTPELLHATVSGAVMSLGSFPPDHTIEYKVSIGLKDKSQQIGINFENISTGLSTAEMIAESKGSVLLLMNNPFEEVDITSLDFDIRILPKNIASYIWSVDLSDSSIKPGHQIQVDVVLESYLSEKKKYQFSLKIPEGLNPGKYELIVLGSSEYEQHLRKTVPYRFIAYDMTSLIEALNDVLSINRDKLYCLLVLPPSGIAVERSELPDLPATKTLVMQDDIRALRIQPYPQWLEKSVRTGTIVADRKSMRITVEK